MRRKKRSTLQPARFRTEEALVKCFLRCVAKRPISAHLVGREFETTNGVADIIQLRLNRGWQKASDLGGIDPQWAFALRSLPYKKVFKTEDFEKLCRTTKGTATKVLRRYADLKFCIRTRKGDWMKVRQPRAVVGEISTIEAKLSNWRRALAQAYRHQTFAARSWVLLDAARAGGALKNIEKFKRLNVGLIVLSKGNQPQRKLVPSKRKPKSQLHFWNANSALARRLRLKVGGVVTIKNV
jgi:hypothetical protein